jgi:hypothetical protein
MERSARLALNVARVQFMIDIATEHLLALREVPGRLPPRPTGRRVHISAVYRWIQRGVRGTYLEAVRIGGTPYTSLEALQRFADHLSSSPRRPLIQQGATTKTRQKQIDEATRTVEAMLRNPRPPQLLT